MSQTVNDYLEYVQSVLSSIPKEQIVKASYDTGFGIHLVDEDLGTSPMTLFVIQHSIAKVKPPNGEMLEWDLAWKIGKSIIHTFIENKENT